MSSRLLPLSQFPSLLKGIQNMGIQQQNNFLQSFSKKSQIITLKLFRTILPVSHLPLDLIPFLFQPDSFLHLAHSS
jgi:hypothetical protein